MKRRGEGEGRDEEAGEGGGAYQEKLLQLAIDVKVCGARRPGAIVGRRGGVGVGGDGSGEPSAGVVAGRRESVDDASLLLEDGSELLDVKFLLAVCIRQLRHCHPKRLDLVRCKGRRDECRGQDGRWKAHL